MKGTACDARDVGADHPLRRLSRDDQAVEVVRHDCGRAYFAGGVFGRDFAPRFHPQLASGEDLAVFDA
jgi:hypothetical protein